MREEYAAPHAGDVQPGTRWRQVKLGTEAIYEVVAVGDEHVEVEVLRAPGLEPRTRVRLTRAALESMEPIGGARRDPTLPAKPDPSTGIQ